MVFSIRNRTKRFSMIVLFSLVLTMGMTTNINIANGSEEQGKTLIKLELSNTLGTVKGLRATLASFGQINLKWTAVKGATSYNIYRAEKSSDDNYTLIGTSNLNSYSDKDLIPNNTYYYKVSGTNADGEGALSSRVSLKNVVKKPTVVKDLIVNVGGTTQLEVSWSAVSGASSYNIYRSEKSSRDFTLIGTSTTTSYSNKDLAENTTYYYKVSAVNIIGEGIKSSAVSGATKIPGKVTGVSVEVISKTQLDLKWRAVSGASSYEIFCSTSASGTYESIGTSTTLSYHNKGLEPNATYYYKISAINILGVGTQSSVVSGATKIPSRVVDLCVEVDGAKQLRLEWDSVGGAKSYKIYRSEKTSESYKYIDSSDEPYYNDKGLKVNTTYYYRVSAVNKLGEGPKSSVESGRTRM